MAPRDFGDALPAEEHIRYAALPTTPDGSSRWAWGVFGEDDEVGTVNHISAATIVEAAMEVRTGAVISLNLPITEPDPAVTGGVMDRERPVHTIDSLLGGRTRDDRLDGLWLQGSTHWDGLAHVRHARYGYYNGIEDHSVTAEGGGRLGIDRWHERLVGRGVLLDVKGHLAKKGQSLDWREPTSIGVNLLEELCDAQGVALRSGDILLLRTGWLEGYMDSSRRVREEIAGQPISSPGLEPDDETIEFLWDAQVAGIAADNPAVEVLPATALLGHWRLIPLFGFALGELWWLRDLARNCANDSRYSCMLVSVPLRVPAGTGAPANVLAIK